MTKRRRLSSHELTIYLLKKVRREVGAKDSVLRNGRPCTIGAGSGCPHDLVATDAASTLGAVLGYRCGKKVALETKSASAALPIRRAGRVLP